MTRAVLHLLGARRSSSSSPRSSFVKQLDGDELFVMKVLGDHFLAPKLLRVKASQQLRDSQLIRHDNAAQSLRKHNSRCAFSALLQGSLEFVQVLRGLSEGVLRCREHGAAFG
mmetsp:Transcript_27956/g.65051  ORF Transcript_27956/g.65051 Transcript_27956/m.65051 type:complete len:113 (-) Transcript_27956:1984-2322(-)